ncbi:chemotaxis protein CheA [Myxococcus sp. AM009]|uniref:chemotaxis protein CheA n=1 Tax=unclassified Myxococcus TaxID=2648731 RepID=UPI001594EAEB|nr:MULTISPECIES: chemotaxis protein CheA [unclassified Myxococcus]NVJ00372.1 chemotaxis protein CheA [Myxococcus sp. AM009]NVJ13901.1 chemotaxis protein CheA [Myxococcus sp. AM010]
MSANAGGPPPGLGPEWQQVLAVFADEAEELLSSMEETLIALEARPDDERLRTLFRLAHNLKGSGSSLGFEALTDYVHGVEDLIQALLDQRLAVGEPWVSLLLEAVDHLRELTRAALAGVDQLGPAHQARLTRLREGGATGRSQAAGAPPPVAVALEDGSQRVEARAASRGRSLRMDVERLDRIVTLAAELSIARGRMTQFLLEAEGSGASWDEALTQQREMDPLFQELQEEVMRVRMVPVGPLFRQHLRTVRDLARAQDKLALLELEGEDVPMDTAVLEALRDPLLHLLRNALDHGIETPAERQAAGKEACGRLRLRAFHDAGSVVVELSDDGRGIQRERVKERARERGLTSALERLRDEEVDRLIFEPGFSTAKTVTELSGRGVGMDVVRRDIEAMRGTVAIRSQEGHGTAMTLRLPLTLAVIQGFAMGVGDQIYVVPIELVQECLELPAASRTREEAGMLSLRGQPLPYLRLRNVFGLGGEAPSRENVVVLRHPDGVVGLAVDHLQGDAQRVIRPLGRLFQNAPGISGSTILGDGRVGLILDTPTLVRRAIRRANAPPDDAWSESASPAASPRNPSSRSTEPSPCSTT